MAQALPSLASEATDPRVLRSRRMLTEALGRLMAKKEFDAISVGEIADEATLNRATFYLHYPDKAALLEAMTEERFRALIERRGISFDNCDGALRAIALGVCDYLAELTKCPGKGSRIPLENSVIPVVEAMFVDGLSRHSPKAGADGALIATAVAWAIFGAARRWFQTPRRIAAEQMAAQIEAVVKPMLLNARRPAN